MAEYINKEEVQKAINDTMSDSTILHKFRVLRKRINNIPTADVAPRSEEGAECPACYGTGRIKTSDWLIKHLSKKRLAEEKAKANAEYEQHIKVEVSREIFAELDPFVKLLCIRYSDMLIYLEIKNKYLEGSEG